MSAFSATWSRSLLAGLVSLLLWAGVAVAPSPARADTAPLDPADPATPATVSADPLPTVQINGVAWAQVVVGNTVYVAGEFSRVRPAGAAPGTQETVRNNLLAYDIRTGQLVTSFAPNLNAQAHAIAASPDGSRIYVGGQFTYANGQPRNRIAAFDTSTGQLVGTFRPAVNSPVKAIAVTDTTVYLGGEFSAVGSTPRARLAAVSVATGALLPWAPRPGTGSTAGNRLPNDPVANARTSSSVLAMVVAGRDQVVVGGRFDSLNGTKATGVGALDAATGATRPFAVNQLITNQGINSAVWSLSTDGATVYGTAYDYYGPGNLEGSFAAAADGGAVRFINDCHGDTYGSFPVNGVLYHATHAHSCGNIGGFPEQNPRVNLYGTAVSLAPTGTVGQGTLRNKNLAGQPAPSVLPWYPTFYAGDYTKQYQAGWSVSGNRDYVVYAGEFPAVNGTQQQGLVRFAVRPLAPNKVGPRATGSFAPTATLQSGAVRLTWRAVHDRDNENLTYRVHRGSENTAPVCEVTRPSQWWNLPTYGCADTTAPAGTHGWVVVATDPAGNRLASSWVTATVGAANSSPARTYGRLVARDGATGHWPLGDGSGATTPDRVGVQDMTVGTGVTRGRAGAIGGDADTAYGFNGTSAGSLATQTATVSPQVFTVEAWFRTTGDRGGKIVGFGNARTGLSTAYDRHVYMDAQGRLSFGVYSGGKKTITTSGTYNDGSWHHVAASMSRAGLSLYVDGALVATRTDVVSANPITGYWRVGGDTSWATGLDWFPGQIDEVAVYPTALTASQVSAHHVAGTTGQAPNVVPTAAFTATTPDHLTASFDASASADTDGRVTGHAWDFGDGTTGQGATATHTYAAAGTYTVRLTVTDDRAGTATTTRQVTVTAPPVGVGSIARDTFGRELASGWGSAETGGAWTPAGTAADMAVTGGSGRLTAAPGTTAGGTLAVSARDVAVQADVVLERAASGGGSWVSLGSRLVGGTLYSAQLFHAADGTVQLSLVRTVSWTDTWLAGTTLPGRYTPGTALTVRFEVEGTAPAALRAKAWTAGTAQPAAWQVQTTDATAALQRAGGLRTSVYTARSATAATAVRVDGLRAEPAGTVAPEPVPNAAPTAAFTATPAGLTAAFDAAGSADTDGQVTAHAWEFGDGGTGTGATASHTYAAAGTYQVRLTVTDDDGATATVTKAVTVTAPQPQPVPDALAADSFEREVTGDLGPADVGGNWAGYGGAANLQVTGGTAVLTAAPAASTGGELAIAAQDLTVQADVVLDRAPTGGGTYASLATRAVGGTRYKAQLWFAANGTVQLGLVRATNWTETWLTGVTLPGTYRPGTALTLRFEVTGSGTSTLRAMAWAEGAAEPTAWQVQATDATASLQRAGGLRLDVYTARSATAGSVVRVDDLWAGKPGQTPPAR